MTKSVFSVPIYFIVWRETLEAAIIVSTLLGLVDQIVDTGRLDGEEHTTGENGGNTTTQVGEESVVDDAEHRRVLKRKLKIQVFIGSAIGLFIALAIGAAFIAVWFTQASNLWSSTEDLWEGIFELIAALMILIMGVTMVKLDRAKVHWRLKLQAAFAGKHVDVRTRSGRWVLLILPLITVMREGLEAVIFVGGVSLGQSATAIPLAAVVGLATGIVCGIVVYGFASRATLRIFLIVMTNFLLLIGAGLFSRAVWSFEDHAFTLLVGADVDDTGGDGPGSYDVRGSVWHLDCCNPEDNYDGQGWEIFNALFGWTNSATIGSVVSYVVYWLAAMFILACMKYKEGRTRIFGHESAAGRQLRISREKKTVAPTASDTKVADEKVASGTERTTSEDGPSVEGTFFDVKSHNHAC
ncbi:iron permease FTR1 [Fistulina hepatica ATCC 64428]|uniref:Iron permease FTR1 n=1 Tax=Fistulina hepatica ATCC 64428 TaxID=1128425 RepID=A0A0D7A8Y3_9AGAR|nr:iron permease FTR1 [Fistulina hepatica ATCC 64428]